MCVHCTVHNFCMQYCTEKTDNFPSYPLYNHHCSDTVYWKEGGALHYCTLNCQNIVLLPFRLHHCSIICRSPASRESWPPTGALPEDPWRPPSQIMNTDVVLSYYVLRTCLFVHFYFMAFFIKVGSEQFMQSFQSAGEVKEVITFYVQ